MLGMSCSRVGKVGKVPPFCFQARFPRHGGAEESKISKNKCTKNAPCHRGAKNGSALCSCGEADADEDDIARVIAASLASAGGGI
jgi:hypothetical protein